MYPRASSAIDGESLQADVMRFMAIIAFCLVAIMALVRDVDAPVQPPLDKTSEPERTEPPLKMPVTLKPTTPVDTFSPPPPIQAKPVQAEPVVSSAPAEEAPQQPEVAHEEAPQKAPRQEDEGLSLRFGSDRDFLRLIAKGDVAVYLFNQQRSFRLGTNYAFAKAPAPGRIHELMPQTIPAAIRSAAADSQPKVQGFRWGVTMSPPIASRIQSLVAVERTGQLVINRFGEVKHQANPSTTRK